MAFQDVFERDKAKVMRSEFSATFRLVSVDGLEKNIQGIRLGMVDQVVIDPGNADTDSIQTTDVEYPQPKPGDRLIDANSVEWIVQAGPRQTMGIWTVPVKSDRRLRT